MLDKAKGFDRFLSTLLFCDVRGFTHFFDQAPPEETFVFVSSFLELVSKVVTESGGRINNLTGDGFLAQFGNGSTDEQETKKLGAAAVRCALTIRNEVAQLNKRRHSDQNFTFSMGIGIHTGMVATGLVNISGNLMPLLLGDAVNTASRIEGLCKFFSVDILLSQPTEELVRGSFNLMPMPAKELRGKAGKFKTFWAMPTSAVKKEER